MVRVTEEEHAQIVKSADGGKLSAYVRECALTGIAARAPVEPPFMEHKPGDTFTIAGVFIVNPPGKEDPVALWQSNLNYWYRTNEGCKEMLDELGHALITRMEKLPMDQRAAFLAQELG